MDVDCIRMWTESGARDGEWYKYAKHPLKILEGKSQELLCSQHPYYLQG